jgi:serine/threonine protein kinase
MTTPTQMSQYRLDVQLGSDRYGELYRAVDTVRRRTVALRLLRVDEIGDTTAVQRFVQQAQRAADLVHPRLAWVWEAGEGEGWHYLVERFINGPTLARRLAESGPLSWEEAQVAIAQIAQGLDFAHGRGFDLGAVRPQNIYLSPELGAVLGGLGLALGLPSNRPIEDRKEALYAAPELWQRRLHTPASDQYALACVLAEMLSGQALFDAPTVDEIHQRHLEALQMPHSFSPGTPWQVELALERALSKQPGERYANAAELAEAPAKLAQRGAGDEHERERRAALAQARKAAEEQAHRLAEEAARLAALEQARRELEEQVRQAAQPPVLPDTPILPVQPAAEPIAYSEEQPEPHPAAMVGHGDKSSAGKRRRWIAWAIGAVLIMLLAGLWLAGRLPIPGLLAASATPTQTLTATFTLFPTGSPTSTMSPTYTLTASPSPTATHTQSPTLSSTPTISATATQTQRPTPIPTTPRPTRDLGAED